LHYAKSLILKERVNWSRKFRFGINDLRLKALIIIVGFMYVIWFRVIRLRKLVEILRTTILNNKYVVFLTASQANGYFWVLLGFIIAFRSINEEIRAKIFLGNRYRVLSAKGHFGRKAFWRTPRIRWQRDPSLACFLPVIDSRIFDW